MSTIGKKGTLVKRGHAVRNWKTRFFVLEAATTADVGRKPALHYFKGPPRSELDLARTRYRVEEASPDSFGAKLRGSVELHGARCKAAEVEGKSHAFAVEGTNKDLLILAPSDDVRREWMMAIQSVIDSLSLGRPSAAADDE